MEASRCRGSDSCLLGWQHRENDPASSAVVDLSSDQPERDNSLKEVGLKVGKHTSPTKLGPW